MNAVFCLKGSFAHYVGGITLTKSVLSLFLILATSHFTGKQLWDTCKHIFDDLGLGLILINRSGKTFDANLKASELIEDQAENIQGATRIDLGSFRDFRLRAGASGTKLPLEEITISARGHKPRYLECGSVNLPRDDRAMIFFREITEGKRTEEKLRLSDQYATMGRLAAEVAHEIKNPLNALSIHLQLLERGFSKVSQLPEAVAGDIAVLRKEIGRLQEVVESFVALARPPDLSMKPIDLQTLIKDVVKLMAPLAGEKKAVLEVTLEKPDLILWGDFSYLKQVLVNLVANALEAMKKKGGRITIEVRRELTTGFVSIEVLDNGPGIPLEKFDDLSKIPFTTKRKGTGLGLGISARIVHQHGGTLDIVSWPGEGTLVTVRLPIHHP